MLGYLLHTIAAGDGLGGALSTYFVALSAECSSGRPMRAASYAEELALLERLDLVRSSNDVWTLTDTGVAFVLPVVRDKPHLRAAVEALDTAVLERLGL